MLIATAPFIYAYCDSPIYKEELFSQANQLSIESGEFRVGERTVMPERERSFDRNSPVELSLNSTVRQIVEDKGHIIG